MTLAAIGMAPSTPRFRITQRDGQQFVGVIQGSGGPVTQLKRVVTAIEQANRVGRTGLPEPKLGHCRLYPRYGAEGQGPHVDVDLRGAIVVEVKS